MRGNGLTRGILAAALLAGLGLSQPAAARARRAAPDLSGLWTNASLTEQERPDDFKTLVVTEAEARAFEAAHRGKPPEFPPGEDDVGGSASEWWERDVGLARIRGQLRTSWIVNPADGQRPATAAAKAFGKAEHARRKVDFDGPESRDPSERCTDTGAGPPLDNGGYNDNFQFVQTPGYLAIHAEWMHDVRVIRIAAKGQALSHPRPDLRFAGGDSIGHWEGDTLVVETTNFSPVEVRDPNHNPAADMRVIERLTRVSPSEILYAYAVTNPARYTQTWQAEAVLRTTKGPIYEYACHEGNYGLPNILAGARRLEGKAVEDVTVGR